MVAIVVLVARVVWEVSPAGGVENVAKTFSIYPSLERDVLPAFCESDSATGQTNRASLDADYVPCPNTFVHIRTLRMNFPKLEGVPKHLFSEESLHPLGWLNSYSALSPELASNFSPPVLAPEVAVRFQY